MLADTSQKLVVLLGAGASAPAGVPTTARFVDDFSQSLDDNLQLKKAYTGLLRRLRLGASGTHPPKLVDVEAVLDALETLRNPTVVDRAIAARRALASARELAKIDKVRERLQEFIRTKCLVESTATEYLLPLVQLSNFYRPLPVFTLNYDVVVEQFLESHGLAYVDGFELRFDPKLYDQQDTDVLLFKLHGSVTWFRSQTGGYLKLPIRSSLREIDLLSGEHAVPAMLYPAQKADYAGPFLELFRRFQDTLRKSEWLLVLGYSFRDPILLDLVLDAATTNPKLKLILVGGRRTERVFAENLAPRVPDRPDSVNQRGALSQERIVRLPFRVEDCLHDLLTTLFPSIQKAMTAHATSIWAQLHGEPTRWAAAVEDYLRAGILSQPKAVINLHFDSETLAEDQSLKFAGLLFLANYVHGDRRSGDLSWDNLKEILNQWLVERTYPTVTLRPQQRVQFAGNWHTSPSGGTGGFPYTTIAGFLSEIIKVGEMLERCLGETSPANQIRPRIRKLERLRKYLSSFPQQGVELRGYLAKRSRHAPRWLGALARSLNNPRSDLSRAGPAIARLEVGLATTELRYVDEEFVRRL